MEENIINLPIGEKIKDMIRKPLIFCVTPSRKGKKILKAEDESTDDSIWENDRKRNSDTGWDEYEVNSGCSPCCSPCSPCSPRANTYQCGPDSNLCYPACNPCNPCYPCNPVEDFDKDR